MDLTKQLIEMIESGCFLHGKIYEITMKGNKEESVEVIHGVCNSQNSFDRRNTWVKFDLITDTEKREVFYLNDTNMYRLLRVRKVKLKRFPNKTNAYYFE